MKDQKIYTEDRIGLKTLDEQGKLFLREIYGALHTDWNQEFILYEILPFLFKKNMHMEQSSNEKLGIYWS